MDLTEPIELELYVLLGIAELIVVLVVVAIVLYLKVRKYKPHYQANTTPVDYIKRYINKTLDYTRDYANSLAKDAENGDITAVKQRMHMVARLNWLVLEKDFISFVNPNASYWDDLNFRIKKMLQRWHELGFVEAPPNERVITVTLHDEHSDSEIVEYDPERGDITKMGPHGDAPDDLRARVHYLEKQVRQMGSYKTLYFGLQNSYEGIQKSYKELKRTIANMRMDAVDADRLKAILAEHEMAEKALEDQLSNMEESRQRLNAELHQLEEAYEALEKEHYAETSSAVASDASSISHLEPAKPGPDIETTFKDLFTNYDNVLREFRGFLHGLQMETDDKLEIDDQIELLENAKNEILTCVKTLEMERDHLRNELDTLQGIDASSSDSHAHDNAA